MFPARKRSRLESWARRLSNASRPCAFLTPSIWAPIAEPVASDIPRRDYDWIPTRAVTDELERLIAAFQAATQLPKRSAGERIKGYLSAHPIIIRTVELLLGYGLMELLLAVTKTSVQFQYVDFRLLFVMLLATLHGLRTGLAASALACLSCFLSYMANGMDWRIIAYNVDNWLPFACFVIMARSLGIPGIVCATICVLSRRRKRIWSSGMFSLTSCISARWRTRASTRTRL